MCLRCLFCYALLLCVTGLVLAGGVGVPRWLPLRRRPGFGVCWALFRASLIPAVMRVECAPHSGALGQCHLAKVDLVWGCVVTRCSGCWPGLPAVSSSRVVYRVGHATLRLGHLISPSRHPAAAGGGNRTVVPLAHRHEGAIEGLGAPPLRGPFLQRLASLRDPGHGRRRLPPARPAVRRRYWGGV